MPQLNLFQDDEPSLAPQAARLAPTLAALAREGIFFGTSSWKYPGWLGSIYNPELYNVRGKVSNKKFEQECLREYALTFPVVGGDFSFYQFPSADYWDRLFGETPASLRFALKVPEEITVTQWPSHARYGRRAGTLNEHFLDPRLFGSAFLRPLSQHADRIAVLMFEFGTFAKRIFATPADFLERLDPFLAELPDGFRYAVEIRNANYFAQPYFDTLSRHNTAHVFNAWTRMPALGDQVANEPAFTADFSVARALLGHGVTYENAVEAFEPYEKTKQPRPEVREALRRMAERARQRKQPAFLLVNNRLEGNAPSTIEAVAGLL